jgi:hypothetical protein
VRGFIQSDLTPFFGVNLTLMDDYEPADPDFAD